VNLLPGRVPRNFRSVLGSIVGSALRAVVLITLLAAYPLAGQARAATLTTKPFRLLGPATTVAGLDRAALLQSVLFSRINATKKTQEAKDCSDRPQVRNAPSVFVLPGQPGKTLTCMVPANTLILIDHNGAICNESKKTKADAECVQKRLDQITEYSVTVDGINLGVQRFKTLSKAFVVTTKDGNAFGFAPGKWKIIAGGWPVAIDKLSPGAHEIVTRYRIGDLSRQTIRVEVTVSP
jgi:hypothetical protein